jgi:hypothetical protein
VAPTLTDALKEADLAVKNAQEVRVFHRKRSERTDRQRVNDLKMAEARVKAAMRPLRSAIGKFPHEPQTQNNIDRQERIRAASARLQSERRKLWKMLNYRERTTSK